MGANNQLAGMDVMGNSWTQGGTWSFSSIPYVLRSGNVSFQVGAPLTIAPGVVVKLANGILLDSEDKLTAVGTSTAPIVFTSLKDDTVGGDTNNDGNASSPAPGDWGMLLVRSLSASNSQIAYAQLRYGGSYPGFNADLAIFSSTGVVVNNCQISSSSVDGILVQRGGSALVSGSTIQFNAASGIDAPDGSVGAMNLQNNLFQGNASFGAALAGAATITGNVFDGNPGAGINFQGAAGAPAFKNNLFKNNGAVIRISNPNI